MRHHKLKSASGYVCKNGCEWDSNPCPHQPETYSGIEVAAILKRRTALTTREPSIFPGIKTSTLVIGQNSDPGLMWHNKILKSSFIVWHKKIWKSILPYYANKNKFLWLNNRVKYKRNLLYIEKFIDAKIFFHTQLLDNDHKYLCLDDISCKSQTVLDD